MGVRRLVWAYVLVLAVSFLTVAAGVPVLASTEPLPDDLKQSITNLTMAPNPAQVGQTVTFTARVVGNASGTGTIPTGTVTFQVGSIQLGPVTLDATGTGITSDSTLAQGSYQVTAMYSGDSNYTSSTSTAMTLNIVPQGSMQSPSTTNVKIVPDPAMLGQTITFTAHVGGATGIGGQGATGTVTFLEGTNQLGTATLDPVSGNASITDANLAVGTYSITAMYGGDANFLPSTSPAVRLDVVPVGTLTPTTTTISSSAPSADFGTLVTFSATVSAGFGNPPTGTVTFNDGGTELGMGTLNNGIATFGTSSLTVGTHSITGVYSGDSTFQGSTSVPFTQTINNSTSLNYILTVNPTTITVNQGNSGTANVTLIPSGGFNQTVTFLCSGLPIYSQCTFSPATITPDGSNTPSTIVMTVSTNVATARLLRPNLRRSGAVLAMFSMGIMGLVRVRGRRQKKNGRRRILGRYASWFSLMLCIAVVSMLASCGGSGSNNRVLTPTGTTTVSIAGSTSTGAQTTSFTLVVQ
jgi:Bacterial Ig-like domain (group 3)